MVQISTSVLLVALLVAPSLALSVTAEHGSVSHDCGVSTHGATQELTQRDLDYIMELAVREPALGSALKKVGATVKKAVTGKSGGGAAGGTPAPSAPVKTNSDGRNRFSYHRDLEYIEELAAREPALGAALKKVGASVKKAVTGKKSGGGATGGAPAPSAPVKTEPDFRNFRNNREYIEELATREPALGSALKKVGATVKKAVTGKSGGGAAGGSPAPSAPVKTNSDGRNRFSYHRDLEYIEELAAREPALGAALKKVGASVKKAVTGKSGGGAAGGATAPSAPVKTKPDTRNSHSYYRDLEYIEELAAREPGLGSALKKAGNTVKKAVTGKSGGGAAAAAPVAPAKSDAGKLSFGYKATYHR